MQVRDASSQYLTFGSTHLRSILLHSNNTMAAADQADTGSSRCVANPSGRNIQDALRVSCASRDPHTWPEGGEDVLMMAGNPRGVVVGAMT